MAPEPPEPYATAEDVENAWRDLTPDETWAAEYLTAYASRKLRSPRLGLRLDDRITAGHVDPELVRDTVVAAVLRVTKNLESVRSHTETIDDHSETWVRDVEVSAGRLYFTDDELADLAPPSLGFGSIQLRLPPGTAVCP